MKLFVLISIVLSSLGFAQDHLGIQSLKQYQIQVEINVGENFLLHKWPELDLTETSRHAHLPSGYYYKSGLELDYFWAQKLIIQSDPIGIYKDYTTPVRVVGDRAYVRQGSVVSCNLQAFSSEKTIILTRGRWSGPIVWTSEQLRGSRYRVNLQFLLRSSESPNSRALLNCQITQEVEQDLAMWKPEAISTATFILKKYLKNNPRIPGTNDLLRLGSNRRFFQKTQY